MSHYATSQVMPYTAQQLFDLAVDVGRYPEFVPLCKRAVVGEHEDQGDGTFAFDSMLLFRFRKFGIYEEFNSRITADPENKTIVSESDSAPFKSFRAVWTFTDLPEGQVEASIDVTYEFRSRALGMFINRGAGIGVQRVIEAWESRAREIYGEVAA